MKFERGTAADIGILHMVNLRVAEVAVEEVCCILAVPRSAMVFGRTEIVDRIADKEALKRAAKASDNHAAGMKQPYNLDLLRRNQVVLQSRTDMAADSLVAGNDSPPWLTISLW